MGPAPTDTVEIGATPDEVWRVLDDPDALASILPGCESIVRDGPDRFRAVIASKLQFFTVRSDVVATLREPDPPRHLRLELEGRPRGLGGSFRVEVPFDIAPVNGGRSAVTYSLEVQLAGNLAALGGPALTGTLYGQIRQLVSNLEQHIAGRRTAGPG